MDTVKHAAQLLQQTEAQLRELVSEAAATSDYDSVVKIASWASAVSNLVKITPSARNNGLRSELGGPRKNKRPSGEVADEPSRVRRPPRSTEKNAYPRFLREGTELIRVAWSKREKKEYQHRAPYSVIQTLATAISKLGADGRIFSTDDLLPISDAEGGEIPSYQAYVGIALLKQAGLIDQHGRRGYSVPRMAEFQHSVQLVLEKIPNHQRSGGYR